MSTSKNVKSHSSSTILISTLVVIRPFFYLWVISRGNISVEEHSLMYPETPTNFVVTKVRGPKYTHCTLTWRIALSNLFSASRFKEKSSVRRDCHVLQLDRSTWHVPQFQRAVKRFWAVKRFLYDSFFPPSPFLIVSIINTIPKQWISHVQSVKIIKLFRWSKEATSKMQYWS